MVNELSMEFKEELLSLKQRQVFGDPVEITVTDKIIEVVNRWLEANITEIGRITKSVDVIVELKMSAWGTTDE